MPAVPSASIEPYLKRSSREANGGSGSSRRNLYQAVRPRIAIIRTRTQPIRISFLRRTGVIRNIGSKRLQVFDQCLLVRRGKLRAIHLAFMSLIAVSRYRRVVSEKPVSIPLRHGMNEAQLNRIVDIIPPVEHLGAF